MAKTVTVSSKGQITLPKALREKHHLNGGDVGLILDTPDGVLIRHGRRSLRGMLKGRIDVRRFEREIRGLRGEWRV
jgi:AbrB family looped-hinge helix DNA binding protein